MIQIVSYSSPSPSTSPQLLNLCTVDNDPLREINLASLIQFNTAVNGRFLLVSRSLVSLCVLSVKS